MSLDAEIEARIKEEREADENEKFLDEQERCWCVQYIDRIASLKSALGELVEAGKAHRTADAAFRTNPWSNGPAAAKALTRVLAAESRAEAVLRKAQ